MQSSKKRKENVKLVNKAMGVYDKHAQQWKFSTFTFINWQRGKKKPNTQQVASTNTSVTVLTSRTLCHFPWEQEVVLLSSVSSSAKTNFLLTLFSCSLVLSLSLFSVQLKLYTESECFQWNWCPWGSALPDGRCVCTGGSKPGMS